MNWEFILVNLLQLKNIFSIFVTSDVSNLLISIDKGLSSWHDSNMLFIFCTFDVLKFFISNVLKLEQLLNILSIFNTFSVLNPDKDKPVTELQLLNIYSILSTLEVSKLLLLIFI